jgi:hypothetical protein
MYNKTGAIPVAARRRDVVFILAVWMGLPAAPGPRTVQVPKVDGVIGLSDFDFERDVQVVSGFEKASAWTVTELTAPPGYVLNGTVDIIKLELGKLGILIFHNMVNLGIIVKKYDEATGQPLPGAEFSFALKGGTIVYEGITDSSGLVIKDDLAPG